MTKEAYTLDFCTICHCLSHKMIMGVFVMIQSGFSRPDSGIFALLGISLSLLWLNSNFVFELSVVKPKPKQVQWPVTRNLYNAMKNVHSIPLAEKASRSVVKRTNKATLHHFLDAIIAL